MCEVATQMKDPPYLQRIQRILELDPSKKKTGRPQILDDDDTWCLKSLLESNPTFYLDKIKYGRTKCGANVGGTTSS